MKQQCGILAYSTVEQEWLIPWWLYQINCTTKLPITIVNCGLSEKMQHWLSPRVNLVPLTTWPSIAEKESLPSKQQSAWEAHYFGDIWKARKGWFLKPFAMAESPYKQTLYLDLDCEVKKDLSSLFKSNIAFGISRERGLANLYNSGVIQYSRDSKLLAEWISCAHTQNHLYPGDQDLLSHLIETNDYAITLLDPIYNSRPDSEEAADAAIIHHVGVGGKRNILASMIESYTACKPENLREV